MNYTTGQTSFADMFEYYCTRNVTNEREYNEREMLRWLKQQLQQAHREGWEQCQREVVTMLQGYMITFKGDGFSMSCSTNDAAIAIASMEYGGESKCHITLGKEDA